MCFHFFNSFALSYEKKTNRGFKSYLKMQLLQVAFWSLHFESSQSAFDRLVLCSHEIKWVIIKFLFGFVLCTQKSVMISGRRNEGEERVERGVREVKEIKIERKREKRIGWRQGEKKGRMIDWFTQLFQKEMRNLNISQFFHLINLNHQSTFNLCWLWSQNEWNISTFELRP